MTYLGRKHVIPAAQETIRGLHVSWSLIWVFSNSFMKIHYNFCCFFNSIKQFVMEMQKTDYKTSRHWYAMCQIEFLRSGSSGFLGCKSHLFILFKIGLGLEILKL